MGFPLGHPDTPGPKPEPTNTPTHPGTVTTTTREDATIGNEHLLRGIPVAGIGGGAISGTRPGDSSLRIERDELHLARYDAKELKARMREARRRLGRIEPSDPAP